MDSLSSGYRSTVKTNKNELDVCKVHKTNKKTTMCAGYFTNSNAKDFGGTNT